MSLNSYVALKVYVDWNNDGDFSDANEDISQYVETFTIKRGRASSTDQFSAASGSFTVRNTDGRFNPFYASSPLYPNVVPGRAVKVDAVYNSTTYPVFKGRWTSSDGSFNSPDGSQLTFEVIDGFEQLRLTTTSIALQENKRVDQCIGSILDSISWSATDRTLDTSLETLEKFIVYKLGTQEALQTAASQELGGGLWMGRDGKVIFRNREYRANQAVTATLSGTFDDLSVSLRQEDTAAIVRASYVRFITGTAGSVVFQISSGGRALYPGDDNANNSFEGEFTSYAAGTVITPVAVTDWTVNSAQDGSGTDKTAQVSISSFTSAAKGFRITFNNLDSQPVYLQTFFVRATPTTTAVEENVVTVQNASPIVEGQTIQTTFGHQSNGTGVAGWASWEAATRVVQQPRVTVTMRPDTDALMALVLGADIWQRMTISDTAASWNSHVAGDYFIESIALTFARGGPAPVTAQWLMFPEDLSRGTLFRISGAAGAGQDYSTIAAATGDGFDRLSY